jgi:hypothetical protein
LRRQALTAALLALASTRPVAAQQEAPGAVEGTIRDRSAFRSVRAARIRLRRVEPDTGVSATAEPDVAGRYRIDSLPPGLYHVGVASAALDSLRVAPPSTEVRITPGRVVLADFTLPSGFALRDAMCGDGRLGARRAAVVGRAIDADADDRPLVGAEVVGVWMDFPVDRTTGRSRPSKRVAVVKTGPAGEYLLCGVPTETLFTLRLRSQGRAGAVVRLLLSEEEVIIARDLSLSTRNAPTIAELDSLQRAATARGGEAAREEVRSVGMAELTGTVRGLAGQPFVGAQVRVRDARSSTVSDSAGRFLLRDLPAGTQILVVQHPGYAAAELPVELRPDKRVYQSVLLVRPRTLDDVRITESALDYEAFDASRRLNPYGQFLTLEQIDQKKNATETVDLFDELLGFSAFGHGDSARVIANSALANNLKCSSSTVFVQGAPARGINDVAPHQIAGIEAYTDAAFVPARFAGQTDCGVIVIWLRKSPRAAPSRGPQLRGNGYP